MLKFDEKIMQIRNLPEPSPNFNNVLKILRNERPDRPTLFELYLNDQLEQEILGIPAYPQNEIEKLKLKLLAFAKAGYDYATIHASNFHFIVNESEQKNLNPLTAAPLLPTVNPFKTMCGKNRKIFITVVLRHCRRISPME